MFYMSNEFEKEKKKVFSPTPGIEPGPPGWKPGILAIRPRGIAWSNREKLIKINIVDEYQL